MSVLLDRHTRVLVQGITGRVGSIQTRLMIEYGTTVVAGVTPGKGGSTVEGIAVFDTVEEAVSETAAEASVFFVPSPFVKDAFYETVAAGIRFIVVVPEHIPVHDVMAMRENAHRNGVVALGPTTPGIITSGEAKMGIMPASLFSAGKIGVISRSGTLSYEIAGILTQAGIGQSSVVGMGSDAVVFTNLSEILELFEHDELTQAVVIVGEVGGVQEEMAAQFIGTRMSKPVAVYIAGRSAPEGKRMGHAGAIVWGSTGTVHSKWTALRDSGAEVLETPVAVVEWAKGLGI